MRAAVLHSPAIGKPDPLVMEDWLIPEPISGEVLLRVEACGVCRTDLHITMGELTPLRKAVVPGHQIVARVDRVGAASLRRWWGDASACAGWAAWTGRVRSAAKAWRTYATTQYLPDIP